MYLLRSLNIPLGAHVPQFGNPCDRTIQRSLKNLRYFGGKCFDEEKNCDAF